MLSNGSSAMTNSSCPSLPTTDTSGASILGSVHIGTSSNASSTNPLGMSSLFSKAPTMLRCSSVTCNGAKLTVIVRYNANPLSLLSVLTSTATRSFVMRSNRAIIVLGSRMLLTPINDGYSISTIFGVLCVIFPINTMSSIFIPLCLFLYLFCLFPKTSHFLYCFIIRVQPQSKEVILRIVLCVGYERSV